MPEAGCPVSPYCCPYTTVASSCTLYNQLLWQLVIFAISIDSSFLETFIGFMWYSLGSSQRIIPLHAFYRCSTTTETSLLISTASFKWLLAGFKIPRYISTSCCFTTPLPCYMSAQGLGLIIRLIRRETELRSPRKSKLQNNFNV